MNSEQIVFVDTETTGLDPDHHEIWEVACIFRGDVLTRETEEGFTKRAWVEKVWRLPVDLGRADPFALQLTNFHERTTGGPWTSRPDHFSIEFARITRGKHLVGAVPSFDEERLRKLLKANGACPEWHYHLIDVEALAAGYLAAKGTPVSLPWDSDELSQAVGITPDTHRHEALYDAQWAKAIYDAVTGDLAEVSPA